MDTTHQFQPVRMLVTKPSIYQLFMHLRNSFDDIELNKVAPKSLFTECDSKQNLAIGL